MEIKVQCFKNIESLDLRIDDNKVNFLFGISGSGKSSLSEAIRKQDLDNNVMLGREKEEFLVRINGNDPISEEFEFFDMGSIHDYVINELPNKKGYELIIQDDKRIKDVQLRYKENIVQLTNIIGQVFELKKNINELKSKLGGKLKKADRELPENAKIFAVKKEVEKISKKEVYKKLIVYGTNYVEWIKRGTELSDFTNGICPFCRSELDEMTKAENLELAGLTVSNLKHIFETSEIFDKFNLNEPDYSSKEQIMVFSHEIRDILRMEESLDKIISLVTFTNSIDINPNDLVKIEVDENVFEFVPELKRMIEDINSHVHELKDIVISFKKTCDQTIGSSIRVINEEIRKLGIPYKIKDESVSSEDEQASYVLYHTNDKSRKRRSDKLSFGEKNIIALLLFIVVNKGKTLIIDDPVSSFDDFRRKQILDIIYKYSDNRTILVLSHDHVFAKFVSFEFRVAQIKSGQSKCSEKNKGYLNLTGIISSFENYDGKAKCKPVSFDDFQTIENHIINNIQNIDEDYYRTMINLRSLIELKKNTDGYDDIYNYTSAILHKTSRDEILQLLEKQGYNEETIVNRIKNLFPHIKSRIRSIPIGYDKNIDLSNWSLYEKALVSRSDCKDHAVKEELNNLVHMNDSLTICLNPYMFNYFSNFVYEFIT